MLKILKKGIRDEKGKYYPVWYSFSQSPKYPGNTVTIYAKDTIKGLPDELNPTNNSDSREDYFENDRAIVLPFTEYHTQVLAFAK